MFSPRWILSHAFVATLVALFIGAGMWQLARLGERQDENALVRSRMGSVQPYSFAVSSDSDALEFVRIEVEGSFDPSDEILIANRSSEGTPGFWMWTNFVTASGDDLLVNRGFVSRSVILEQAGAAPLSDAASTPGLVTIEGLLRLGFDGGRSSDDGSQLSRPDAREAVTILEIEPRLDPNLYLQLEVQDPPRGTLVPAPVPSPDLGEGPHRSYAFQWFTFATIGAFGYGILLLRIRRGDATRGDVPHDAEPSASGRHLGV